jgi:aarF domain-containing kinase
VSGASRSAHVWPSAAQYVLARRLVWGPGAAVLLTLPACWWASQSSWHQAAFCDSPPPTPEFRTEQPAPSTLQLVRRAFVLLCIIVPLLGTYPLAGLHTWVRRAWLTCLLHCLRWCGPAFTKWGQWAAGRPDLLPLEIRAVLETLHTAAPMHSPSQTLQALQYALPAPVDELFDELEVETRTSGAISQVHRAVLSARGAEMCGVLRGQVRSRVGVTAGQALTSVLTTKQTGISAMCMATQPCQAIVHVSQLHDHYRRRCVQEVAIKVRHPHVARTHVDFQIMAWLARVASRLPALRNLRFEDSVQMFGVPLHQQLDLQLEAAHLERFRHNFRCCL